MYAGSCSHHHQGSRQKDLPLRLGPGFWVLGDGPGWRLQCCLGVVVGTEPWEAISSQRGHDPSSGSVYACRSLTSTPAFQGKLDTLCDFVQRCSQAPLMWCPPRAMVF